LGTRDRSKTQAKEVPRQKHCSMHAGPIEMIVGRLGKKGGKAGENIGVRSSRFNIQPWVGKSTQREWQPDRLDSIRPL